jgi:serine/threonine protein kinase/Tol biopolymer transport system component
MPLPAGTKLGRYEIRSLLGKGGMGEVYLADDTALRRPAAIKVLIGDFTENEERLHRFEREAYAASSLNHPNIVTIYEIGTEAKLHFIATECVDGESLRQHLRAKQIELREIVEIAIQVASALTAAHEAGIIHRDIKPENIMLRPDGYVKVLDFGLAKLSVESETKDTDAEADTQLLIKTEPGRLMGTVDYMSPEQARGIEVDTRTDIFSLGVVLYELVAGRRPFAGPTKSDVLADILRGEPEPLARLSPSIPAELNRIVSKALRKDREERYQTAKDLFVDLKSLRRELDSNIKVSRETAGAPADSERATTVGGAAAVTAAQSEPNPSTISELFINEVKRNPRRATVTMVVVGLAIVAGIFGVYRLIKLAQRPDSFQNMRLAKLTTAGDVSMPEVAISPDGKYVVYAVNEAGQKSLWVRQVATSSSVLIVPPADVDYEGLTLSRDGSYVYYSIIEKKGSATLYQVPVLGGPSRKLIEDAQGPLSFSPDGNRLVFRRGQNPTKLMIANADGTALQTLATRPTGEIWQVPSWSSDGLIIVAGVFSLADNQSHLVTVAVKDGAEKPFATSPWRVLTAMSWLPDGSGLVISGRDPETKLSQIWLLSYPEGAARRVTNDLNTYAGVSLTADGKTLTTIQGDRSSNIWIAPGGDANSARRITSDSGKEEGLSGLGWTPDGRIIHSARVAGTIDLWIVDADGNNSRQLTFKTRNNHSPSVTPDGRYIVFVSDRMSNYNIWRMDLDGSNAKQLTNTTGAALQPECSSDGKWVLYTIALAGKTSIWKVSIDGGDPIQLTSDNSRRATLSPDGKSVACEYGEAKPDAPLKIAIIPSDGGPPSRLLDFPNLLKSSLFRWAADGRGLIYRDSGNRVQNLWSQLLDGGAPKQLTDFKSDQIFSFDWSRDGKNLAVVRGRDGSDVVLISNFR